MKRKKLKSAIALGLMSVMIAAFPGKVSAASSDTWKVDYSYSTPGLNPVDYLSVAYCSDGFKADCKTLTGSYDRHIEIAATNAGGIKNKNQLISITTTGTTDLWKTNDAISSDVSYRVNAFGSKECYSTGIIRNLCQK